MSYLKTTHFEIGRDIERLAKEYDQENHLRRDYGLSR